MQNVAGKNVRHLTRGEVRKIEALKGADQTDEVVRLTILDPVDLDDLPMPEYVEILRWALSANGLDGSSISVAKKN